MTQAEKPTKSYRQKERGSVLAYTVVSALFLFMAVGLGVDLSHLYLAKAELQNTADAAALAGASALTIPTPSRISTAVDRALQIMNLNKYNFDNRNYADVTSLANQRALVEFAVNLNDDPYMSEADATANPDNIRFVRVRTPSVPVSVFFAVPVLGSSRNLNARATAGLSVPGNVNYCPAPLAVIDCGADPQCLGPDGTPQSLGGVCNTGGPKPNPDGTACNPSKQFCRNCVYTIRAEPAGGPAPGNFHGLCCPNQTCDAEWIRQRLAGGNDCIQCPPANPGDEITPTTKPGINAGPVRQGINTRFDEYNGGTPPLNPTDNPPDPNIATNGDTGITFDQYTAGSPFQAPSHPPQDGRRLLILPVTPYSSWIDANGRATVTVSSLGAFFLQKKVGNGNDGAIQAEYVGPDIVSAIGRTPGGTNTTNVVTPVLYR
ncbi:MAG TPA: Tad domain-containing protein [Pyrinomonadaceae bacterium]|jgi:Flp pilus assembly protein TadG